MFGHCTRKVIYIILVFCIDKAEKSSGNCLL